MDIILNWLIGFFIWFLFLILFALVTILIVGVKVNPQSDLITNDLFNYSRKSDIIPNDAFLMDTHAHTLASDGKMTPEQLIKWEIANGFNAFTLTDHNTDKNNEEILALQPKYPNILIIPGFEWTTNRVHLNFIGLKKYPHRVPLNPSDEDIKFAIKTAKDLGAIVQVDHISWTLDQPLLRSGQLKHPTRMKLLEWGVDGFEINNEMRWYDPKTVYWLNALKNEGKLPRPIYMGTGTDIHNPLKEWATGWTELLLTPEERKNPNWETVKKALLEGRTRIWVDHDYCQPPEAKKLKEMGKYIGIDDKTFRERVIPPLFALKHGIEKIPGTPKGIALYVLWALIAYFPIRLLFSWIFAL